MDINTLAAWGEFLGGIAVVISLVYLAGQVRQNSNLLRASATSTTSQLHMAQNEMIAKDPEVSLLFHKGVSDPDSLSEPERDRFGIMLSLQVQAMQQSFEFEKKGIGSEASWCWTHNGMSWFATKPGFIEWWTYSAPSFMPAFREYVSGQIHEGEAAG